MFVPLKDKNFLRDIKFSYVNAALIIANIVIFFLSLIGFTSLNPPDIAITFGVVPLEILGGEGKYHEAVNIPENFTLFTYMFLHGGLMHLGVNMLVLWVLGDNVEDAMGHFRYLVFYIACGVFAALFHVFILSDSSVPMIGASGAASGIIAAYFVLFPKARIWGLLAMGFPVPLPAFIALGLWILTQFVSVAIIQDSQVAWWGHIGGLIAGAVGVIFLRKKSFPLFDKTAKTKR